MRTAWQAVCFGVVVVSLGSSGLVAQPANFTPLFRPGLPDDAAVFVGAVQSARSTSSVGEEVKAQADALVKESTGLPAGEARRRLAHALTLLRGQTWDAKQEFLWSLTLRMDRIIADSTHPSVAWLAQLYPAAYTPASPLELKVTLAPETAGAAAVPAVGTFEIFARDMVERPYPVSVAADGVADGLCNIRAELMEGGALLCTLQGSERFVRGIDARRAEVERRLAAIEGHEGTKASIRYPFDLARVINIGRKNLNEADLGIDEQSQLNLPKFGELMQRSDELLGALESGKDPLWQAKGDIKGAYWFAEAGEIEPYRLYVPTTWDGHTPLPMILILHGNTRDQDFYFDRNKGIIPTLGEKNGYLLVCPFAYNPNGGYNAGPNGRGPAPAAARAGGRGGSGGVSQHANGMPNSRLTELSELDAMNVFELVRKEYPIDPKRTFLFGYSAGGTGSYYFGLKYGTNWAAVSLGGSAVSPNSYPIDQFKELHIPIRIFFGDQDSAGVIQNSRSMVQAMKEHGVEAELGEYKGQNHDTTPGAAVTDVFAFFNAHPRN